MTGSSPTPMMNVEDVATSSERMACAVRCGVRASMSTLTGTDHPINQDYLLHLPGRMSGVADGVGGGAHGEVASRMLLQLLSEQSSLAQIDEAIQNTLAALGHGPGASVFASVQPVSSSGDWQALWVGDCQITHFEKTAKGWRMAWQSQAQTYRHTHENMPAGVDPDAPSNMVGCGLNFPAGQHRFRPGGEDRIVIASDGFHKVFSSDEQIALIAQAASPLNMEVAQTWCELARRRGSRDDISVLILELARPRWHTGSRILIAACVLTLLGMGLQWALWGEWGPGMTWVLNTLRGF